MSGSKYADRFVHYIKSITEIVIGAPSETEKLHLSLEEEERRQAIYVQSCR